MSLALLSLHFANNYGAVLQAYAMQRTLEDIGEKVTIINFANEYQLDADSLYPVKNGVKRWVKRVLMIRYHEQRKQRILKFDDFRNRYLNLSQYCKEEYKAEQQIKRYKTVIVGSDQVWNPLKGNETSNIYFLKNVDEIKKIAYAASIGNATKEAIAQFKDDISAFDYISVRENRGKEIIGSLIDNPIHQVIDPTLIVNPNYFKIIEKEYSLPFDKYIFYYSLDGYDKRDRNNDLLSKISNELNLPVVAITPEWPKKGALNVSDAGPEEFLWLIDNAELVCTTSFHGTALSLVLNKNFIVLEKYDGEDDRKVSILKDLNLENRATTDENLIDQLIKEKIDYEKVSRLLNKRIIESRDYLTNSLLDIN